MIGGGGGGRGSTSTGRTVVREGEGGVVGLKTPISVYYARARRNHIYVFAQSVGGGSGACAGSTGARRTPRAAMASSPGRDGSGGDTQARPPSATGRSCTHTRAQYRRTRADRRTIRARRTRRRRRLSRTRNTSPSRIPSARARVFTRITARHPT